MKTRNGFVSNSSSTSFCIIGVSESHYIEQLANAEKLSFPWSGEMVKYKKIRGCQHKITGAFCSTCGKPDYVKQEVEIEYDELEYGCISGKILNFYGSDDVPIYSGIDAMETLETMNLEEARIYFSELVKKNFDVDVPFEAINLYYGEEGNG